MRIAFFGNFGALNLGNECTLAAAIVNLRARLPQAELLVVCRGPADAAARHGITALPMNAASRPEGEGARSAFKPLRAVRLLAREAAAWLQALRHAWSFDALLITGSGILSDEDEGLLGLPYELFKWSLVTRLCGRKLFFVSVGAESISQPLPRKLLKGALWLANYRCYRDTHSAQLLQGIGFNTQGDAVRPDLAFSLPQLASQSVAATPSKQPGRATRFAIGVFNYRGRGQAGGAAAEAYGRYLDGICTLVVRLLEQGSCVRVIIGDYAYDDAVRADVRSELERRGVLLDGGTFADEPTDSFEQLLDQLAAVDFVVASRYHNVLLGLALGKPCVSLSYEGKHEALMRSMGLGDDYCQSINDFDIQRLGEQIERLTRNAEALRPVMARQTAANRTSLQEQYDLIARRINGPGRGGDSRRANG
jgi:polysaccharide pyruvyl transferase WcaK-like protein